MKKGYVIGQIKIKNAEHYKEYASKTEAILKKYGGKYLVRGGIQDVREGTALGDRDVVLEFESLDKAKAYYESNEYQEIINIRKENSDGYILFVEGY
ncbi:MAG: DUF1330 domain-containing protein [Rickettsiales bacterium TMED254]|nr:MAG: DUF1330 domain-containing protein [Rickettsiales bacterium TMED254]|tara:strand:- start:1054 stop:1344 length:291 start_codon:yes stop_codon:yes gene_type:complete